jgi:hypothetical protein
MCVKIIGTHEEKEFDPELPLEQQVKGSKQVVISYKADDSRLDAFMSQMDRIIKTGIGCQMNIRFDSNHSLAGYQFERELKKTSENLDINDAVRMLVEKHYVADKKLSELEQLCLKGIK